MIRKYLSWFLLSFFITAGFARAEAIAPEALVKNAVRNMAFEVYLEQEVPDCH